MGSRFKTTFEKAFDGFLRERFGEHHRRIVKGRRNARWALFTYPLGLCVLCALPVAAVTIAVAVLYEQNHPRVAEVLKPESAAVVMPILYALCAGVGLVGLLLGVSLGLGKAAQMIFESEQQELTVRQTYYLRGLLRAERRRAARREKRATSGRQAGYGATRADGAKGYETGVHGPGHVQVHAPVHAPTHSPGHGTLGSSASPGAPQAIPDLSIRPRG